MGTAGLPPVVLVAGIGNIFQGDDAFGGAVARALLERPRDERVRVVDFGTRGFDLALALSRRGDLGGPVGAAPQESGDRVELALLVDTVQRGGSPGTLYVIDPAVEKLDAPADPHSLHPANVLALVAALGARPPRVLIVGCEPLRFATDEEPCPELSAPVRAAIPEAVALVERLVAEARAHA